MLPNHHQKSSAKSDRQFSQEILCPREMDQHGRVEIQSSPRRHQPRIRSKRSEISSSESSSGRACRTLPSFWPACFRRSFRSHHRRLDAGSLRRRSASGACLHQYFTCSGGLLNRLVSLHGSLLHSRRGSRIVEIEPVPDEVIVPTVSGFDTAYGALLRFNRLTQDGAQLVGNLKDETVVSFYRLGKE